MQLEETLIIHTYVDTYLHAEESLKVHTYIRKYMHTYIHTYMQLEEMLKGSMGEMTLISPRNVTSTSFVARKDDVKGPSPMQVCMHICMHVL